MRESGQPEEAERCFRRLCELDPTDVDALVHLGALLYERGSFPESEDAFISALRLAPGNARVWLLLGSARAGQGKAGEAIEAYSKAIERDAGMAEAHTHLADLRQSRGELDAAIGHYRQAIRLSPTAAAYNNLGCALVRNGQPGEAVEHFGKALELQPGFADAHMNLGSTYTLLGARDQAIRSHRAALALRAEDGAIRECLLSELQNTCDWAEFDTLCALQRRSAVDPDQRVSPFSLLSIPSTPEEQLRCAKNFARRYEHAASAYPAFRFDRSARERLRIGYLSADLHDHVTAYVMAEMFELHDRRQFDVIAYSYGPDDRSPMRSRLVRAFDRFVEASRLSHRELAQAIHADGVDLLVDLKGYTQYARTEVTAMRPAPIQIAYMGYPGSLAAGFIDYLVADRFVIPPEQESHYGESLVFLPGTYYVNDRTRPIEEAPSRAALGLPAESFVFCCFNQTYKILPHMFSVWMKLLRALPQSVLWLLDTNPWAKENLRREASRRGVEAARLVFAPRVPAREHLARVGAADLFLDTLPYNAHTTATDALWAGVPVVTCPGDTFASRVAGSLLTALGIPELITGSLEEYEARALSLARDPEGLAVLRAKVAGNRSSTALFDTPSFTRNLETAYRAMWEDMLLGRRRAIIEVCNEG